MEMSLKESEVFTDKIKRKIRKIIKRCKERVKKL
jgi:hypothetical protein